VPEFRSRLDVRPFEAGMLPDSQKEQLCRTLLAEFGVTSVNVRPDGEMIHSCPLPFGLHKNGDRNPSASLNYKKLTFICRSGCGSGGLLWFIATCRGEDIDSSRRWLEDQTGAGPDEQSLGSLLEFFDAVYGGQSQAREPMPKMSEDVLRPWMLIHPYMTDPLEQGGRGIPMPTMLRFKIGYAQDYRMNVGGKEVSSERIIIPHFWRGDLVGWQSRRIINDGTPKYASTPGMPKDQTLFNFDQKATGALVVESPLSVLSHAHHMHLEATFGAEVTDRQCSLISVHRRTVLWMDNDNAGYKATKRLGDYLSAYCDVWVVDNPWAADPADLPDVEVQRLVGESLVPYALWNPPRELLCWDCKAPAHEGACA
jgi:hypothetical protein